MLVIPARDILLRSVILPYLNAEQNHGVPADDTAAQQQESLLADEERPPTEDDEDASSHGEEAITASFSRRLITSIGIFWTAGLVASCVSSIDIVWDLLGSSLIILLSFLIPSGCYLVIMRDVTGDSRVTRSKALCWILILIFVPLMFVSTGNAVANTFFN
jgi:amino acid permease